MKPTLRWAAALLAVVAMTMAIAPPAVAHKSSDAYVEVVRARSADGSAHEVRIDLALRDVDLALGLDEDGDGRLTWGEVRRQQARIAALVAGGIDFSAGSGDAAACSNGPMTHAIDRHSDGNYAVVRYRIACAPGGGGLRLRYRLFGDIDADHRAIVRSGDDAVVVVPGAAPVALRRIAAAADAGDPAAAGGAASGTDAHAAQPAQPAPSGTADALRQFGTFVASGVHHILIGWDHLAFLLALLVPAALQPRFGAAFASVLWTATAFTLAHSLTLSAAALGWIRLPVAMIESAIAASIVVTAVVGIPASRRLEPYRQPAAMLLVAFAFGLVHGFGFANVLNDAGLAGASIVRSLLGFNLGVELGQLAFIAIAFPLLWLVARAPRLRRQVFPVLLIALATVGVYWLVERAGDVVI